MQIIGLDGKGAPDDSVTAYKKLVEAGRCLRSGRNQLLQLQHSPLQPLQMNWKVPAIATAASNEQVTVDSNGKFTSILFPSLLHRFLHGISGRFLRLHGAWPENLLQLSTDITDSYSTSVGDYMVETFTRPGWRTA